MNNAQRKRLAAGLFNSRRALLEIEHHDDDDLRDMQFECFFKLSEAEYAFDRGAYEFAVDKLGEIDLLLCRHCQ